MMLRPHGKFAFAIWDWEWSSDCCRELTPGWENVFMYQINTVCDFNCTVLSENKRTVEWAQFVFDNFFTIKNLKEATGLNCNSEAVDRIIRRISRELIPVRYE